MSGGPLSKGGEQQAVQHDGTYPAGAAQTNLDELQVAYQEQAPILSMQGPGSMGTDGTVEVRLLDDGDKAHVITVNITAPTGQPAVAPTTRSNFYNSIFPSQGLRVLATFKQGLKAAPSHTYYDTNEDFLAAAETYDGLGKNVYHGCATYKTNDSRKGDNVEAVKALWIDADVGPTKPYATGKDAAGAIEKFRLTFELDAPYVIKSGSGVHAYFPFTVAIDAEDWQRLAATFAACMDHFGLKHDSSRTQDIASILRIPDTHNYKTDPPKSVKLLRAGVESAAGAIYRKLKAYADVAGIIDATPRKTKPTTADDLNGELIGNYEHPPSDAKEIVKHCAVLAEIDASGGDAPYEIWWRAMGVAKHCVAPEAVAMRWTKNRSATGHSQDNWQVTVDNWTVGPTTCDEFAKHSSKCATCTYKGKGKSPIMLGNSRGNSPGNSLNGGSSSEISPDSVENFRLKSTIKGYSHIDTPDWILPEFNAAGEITVWAGLPAVGKTTGVAALVMVIAGYGSKIDSDIINPTPRTVIIVSESSLQYQKIFHGYCDKFNIAPVDLESSTHIYDAVRLHRHELSPELVELVRKHPSNEPPLIILDTASAMFDLTDENSNAEVAGMIAEIKNHVIPTGAAVWIIAHAAKPVRRDDSEAMPRGASSYIGDAHATGAVFQSPASPDTTFFKSLKFRHERQFDEIGVETFTHAVTATDRHGIQSTLTLRLGVPKRTSLAARAQLVQAIQTASDQQEAQFDLQMAEGLLKQMVIKHGSVAVSNGGRSSKVPESLGACTVLSIKRLRESMKVGQARAAAALVGLRHSGTHDTEDSGWCLWKSKDAA